MLFVTVLVANDIKPPLVERIVYSSKDLIVVREVLQQVFLQPEQIPVSTSELSSEILTFSTMERYNNGAVLTYNELVSVDAFYDGLVVFTGHTKYTGKTMTVLYNEGTTVTYGFLDELMLLPYTPINAGQSIGKQQHSFYLQIEQDGRLLNLEEMLAWLKGYD
ncbi:MAG: peptidoglycan DD-metalloendopeptidase family protein [Solibacillus sp.]